jgi:hypothetical protein
MEAAVAERKAEMTEWNDGRLDELSKRVNEGFAEMRVEFQRVDGRLDAIHGKFDALNERFDAFYRVLIQGTVAMVVGILGLLGVLIGLVGL